MQLDLGDIAFGLANPPAVGYILNRAFRLWPSFYLSWMTSAVGGVFGAALPPADWTESAASGASLIIAAVFWWLSRRKRKRAPRSYGAKTRALLAAIVRKAREAAKPRHVLRPVPGGSGA